MSVIKTGQTPLGSRLFASSFGPQSRTMQNHSASKEVVQVPTGGLVAVDKDRFSRCAPEGR